MKVSEVSVSSQLKSQSQSQSQYQYQRLLSDTILILDSYVPYVRAVLMFQFKSALNHICTIKHICLVTFLVSTKLFVPLLCPSLLVHIIIPYLGRRKKVYISSNRIFFFYPNADLRIHHSHLQ